MNNNEPIPASEETREALRTKINELLRQDGFQLDERIVESHNPDLRHIIAQRSREGSSIIKIVYGTNQTYAYRTQILDIGLDNKVKRFFDIRIPMTDEMQAVFEEVEVAFEAFQERSEELEAKGYQRPEPDNDEIDELMEKIEMSYDFFTSSKSDDDRLEAQQVVSEIMEELVASIDTDVPILTEAEADEIAKLPEDVQALLQNFLLAHSRHMNAISALLALESELASQAVRYISENFDEGFAPTEADAWNMLRILDEVQGQ